MIITDDGQIPMRWWDRSINYGDIIGPYLVERMTGRKAVLVEENRPHYRVLGPLIGGLTDDAVLWGTGSWGTEKNTGARPTIHSVRGPLTRNTLINWGNDCPRIYGDPALLLSQFYQPRPAAVRHPVGVVFRWSERNWNRNFRIPGVKLIEIRTDDIEGTIDQICACDRIVTSSLHVLITADVYGIPSAWIHSDSTKGGEFKFLDYFISVGKLRDIQFFDPLQPGLTADSLRTALHYAEEPIRFDPRPMIEVNPFGWRPGTVRPVGALAG